MVTGERFEVLVSLKKRTQIGRAFHHFVIFSMIYEISPKETLQAPVEGCTCVLEHMAVYYDHGSLFSRDMASPFAQQSAK